MKATKNGKNYDYTGHACFFSGLGVWHECDASYQKGSALGVFANGELVAVLRSNCSGLDAKMMLGLKF